VLTLPRGVTRRIRPVLRSLISASPEARKTIPQGTSRLSATVPASRGRGGPVGVGLALGVGLGVALPLGEADGLDGGVLDGAGVEALGSTSSAQPVTAPTAAPAETSRKRRRESMPTIVARPATADSLGYGVRRWLDGQRQVAAAPVDELTRILVVEPRRVLG
jgi:hypothetical protein